MLKKNRKSKNVKKNWKILIWKNEKKSQVNFISDIRIYIYKKIQFSITEINIEIKTTATAVIKNELNYFLSEGNNTCKAEPNMIQ